MTNEQVHGRNHRQAHGRNALLQKRGKFRRLLKQVHWRKLGAQSLVASHWLSGESLSLAGLLPGVQESLSSSRGVNKVESVRQQFLPVGFAVDREWQDERELPLLVASQLHILVRFPFITFTTTVASALACLFVLLTKSKRFIFIYLSCIPRPC